MTILIHKEEDFVGMRKAGRFAAEILDYITDFVNPGITTNEINDLCHTKIIENGAIPAPLNYKGFPKSVCTSVNHVVCHGIPDDKMLKDGDIVNVDVTVIVDGWHGDTSRTFFVGDNVPIKAKRVTRVAYEAMMKGINSITPGVRFGEIGFTIESFVNSFGYSSVRDYCGHGIGRIFHAEPNVLHFGKKEDGEIIREGMFFTVEPMINIGSFRTKLSQKDGWTVTTKDRSLSAQFEHTVGITKDGVEIFTKSPKGLDHPNFENVIL